jgi:hypothetical protein
MTPHTVNGRLFGDGRSGYARVRDDWYVEEELAVEALLRVERFDGKVFDPACGGGNIPRICRAHGLDAVGSDKVARRAPAYCKAGVDFLTARSTRVDNIICDPPFCIAEAFVLRALERARRKVAMLLRLAFLEGTERYERIYRRYPPFRIWVFTWRTPMPPGEALRAGLIEREGGKMAFCWIVWQRGYRGPTMTDWLRR